MRHVQRGHDAAHVLAAVLAFMFAAAVAITGHPCSWEDIAADSGIDEFDPPGPTQTSPATTSAVPGSRSSSTGRAAPHRVTPTRTSVRGAQGVATGTRSAHALSLAGRTTQTTHVTHPAAARQARLPARITRAVAMSVPSFAHSAVLLGGVLVVLAVAVRFVVRAGGRPPGRG